MGLSDLLIYDGTISVQFMVWAIYIGIAIAVIASYFIKVRHGKLINLLISKGANSPETALSLDKIGKSGFFTKLTLKNHIYYKDALVAITEDGKYYANYRYTDEPPSFKLLKSVTRKRRSKIKENKADSNEETAQIEIIEETKQEISAAEEQKTDSAPTTATEYKRERVKFNPATAKYYIPAEVQAKVGTIYNENKTKLWVIILALIGCAVLTFFASSVLEQILQMVEDLGKGNTSI